MRSHNRRLDTKKPIHVILLCLALFTGLYMPAGLVYSQPGTRPKITANPRKNTRKVNRRDAPNRGVGSSEVSLWIVSNPANSKVFVNGDPRGETNAAGEVELKVSPGTYAVRVSRDGYVAREADVEVLTTPAAQQVEFTLPTSAVTLHVVTNPPGAEVYLDSVYKGATGPDGLLVLERVNPNQPHTLWARKEGYVHQPTPVTSYTGQISLILLRDSVSLKITTDPPEAEVYLDDSYKGTSTSDGILLIEQVNPNRAHSVRAKKEGYRQQSLSLAPNVLESTVKLPPDPIVLLVRDIKQHLAERRLIEASGFFNQLLKEKPDHPEFTRLSESILLGVQALATERLNRIEPYGLAINLTETEEMSSLYDVARTWRPGDDGIDNLGKYWSLRLALLKAERASSIGERDGFRQGARQILVDLSDRNLRNPFLVLDLGWSWWKLNDKSTAQKHFKAAQELRPQWAYPYFALGFLSMQAAENERAKSAKVNAYTQALENFTKAITFKHDFALAYALKSTIYGVLEKDEESMANALQAVAVDPQSSYAHFALGSAYFEKGKSGYRNALAELNQAIALGGKDLNEPMKNAIQIRLARIRKSLK